MCTCLVGLPSTLITCGKVDIKTCRVLCTMGLMVCNWSMGLFQLLV